MTQVGLGAILPLTTLTHLNGVIGRTDTTNDDDVWDLIQGVSQLAETVSGRNLRARSYGTGGLSVEYGDGNGKFYHRTQEYPILSIDSLYDDANRLYESETLKASTDYLIDKVRGRIELLPNAAKGAIFQKASRNIKITYMAGYGSFTILDGINDTIDFEESVGVELTATVAEGEYTPDDLETAIKAALDTAGASTYTVTYNEWTGKFTLASDLSGGGNTFKLLWNTGTNTGTSIARTIGFADSADDDTAASHEGDYAKIGIPPDLERAVVDTCQRYLSMSKGFGGRQFDVKKEIFGGSNAGTREYDPEWIPDSALKVFMMYRRPNV